jgi:hypothetical protein
MQHMPFRAILLGVLACALSLGQGTIAAIPSQPSAKRYAVSGTVYNTLTNEPIRRALVHLNGPEQHVAFTGADGGFQFENVPEGQVWISAQRPGYFTPRPEMVAFRVGSGSNNFRIPLTPESKITGTVLDGEGEPVENIQVQVMGEQVLEGHKQWMMRGATSTDENGMFKLDGQMPGAVIVCTGARPLLPYNANSTESYPARCYPNATDVTSAQKIEIAAGQSAQVDFTLEPVRSYSVSGMVSGAQPGRTGAWVEGIEGQQPSIGVPINARTGVFRLRLPNGTWKIHFQSMSGGQNLETVEEVNVNGADVTGLQVTLAPGADIPVEIVRPPEATEQTATGPNTAVPVLRLTRPGSFNTAYTSSFVPDRHNAPNVPAVQAISNVPPGTYNVSVMSNAVCVGSVSSGSVDLLREPLTIAAGSSPEAIVVNLRADCGSIDVTVRTDRPELPFTLLLVPETPGLDPQMHGFSGNSYTLANLSPGTYHVYAVSDAAGLEYANSEAMRDIPGETVTLEANQKASVTVPVYERGKQ